MIFLGTLFPEHQEGEVISNSRHGVANAANSFQWKMIHGLQKNHEPVKVINVLPVGTWPGIYRRLYLPDRTWEQDGIYGVEIGGINLPLLKQAIRAVKITRKLRQYTDETEIILFSAYLPFLFACHKLPANLRISIVVTDIPEYYDMHQVSVARRLLRKLHNRFVYHYMKDISRFILLTDEMRYPLNVGNRPYMVMEGICSDPSNIETPSDDHIFSLLYTGRLNRRYGLLNLLDAMDRIPDSDIELWICGSGELEDEIRTRARKDSRVRFLGFVPHEKSLQLQRKATILINPRTNEGAYTKYSFPSKTLEYMVAGKPVLMYRLDGIPKEYDSYLYYIPDETADSIAQSILQLKGMSPEERLQIANAARDFVLDNKNEKTQMQRLLDFIHSSW